MTPEAGGYLAKAREDLSEAKKILAIGLAGVAARSAYYAMFHAAQALIVEATGKIAKTHTGVRSEFARFARDTGGFDRSFSASLARVYKFKELADYAVGRDAIVSTVEAKQAIDLAETFVGAVDTYLASISNS